jgi:flavin reductase (DIM6/NTAB) family NADH-FMN oxidoreductase RutF
MKYGEKFDKLCEALEGPGAFLVVEDKKGRVNVMTIGWAQLGVVWGEPVLTVLVRPSRHTHSLLEKAAHFSVCVPARGAMKKELAFCGTKSGREYDKARACSLTLKAGKPGVKYIEGCALVYQCEILAKTNLAREKIGPGPLGKYYPGHDAPHTLYFGKVLKAECLE